MAQFVVFEIRIMAFACKYPENETLPLGDLVPPKPRILEVWVLLMSTKILIKIFWPLGVSLVHCCAWSVHSYIGRYVIKYVVKDIVIPCYFIICTYFNMRFDTSI